MKVFMLPPTRLKHTLFLSVCSENERTGTGRANTLERFRSPTKGPCPGQVSDLSPHFLPASVMLAKATKVSRATGLQRAKKKCHNIFSKLWEYTSKVWQQALFAQVWAQRGTSVMPVCATLSTGQDKAKQIQTPSEVRTSRGNNQ